MKQHTKLAILALIAAGVLIPTTLVLSRASTPAEPAPDPPRLVAATVENIPFHSWVNAYNTGNTITIPCSWGWGATFSQLAATDANVMTITGLDDVVLPNGTRVIIRVECDYIGADGTLTHGVSHIFYRAGAWYSRAFYPAIAPPTAPAEVEAWLEVNAQ